MVFNVLSMVTPFFNAIELDLWIVFPSAIGSLNGMPISIAEHNFSSRSLIIISLVNSTFGNPDVRKGTIPIPFLFLSSRIDDEIDFISLLEALCQ